MKDLLNRRDFLKVAGLGAGAVALPGSVLSGPAGTAEAKRPNVIFLLTDDQAYSAIGCNGNSVIKTPNMDKLGADGVIFDRAYTTTSICMASRATFMTGLYEYRTGCNFSHGPLDQDKFDLSYPVLLRKAGYRIGFIGKFGFAVKPTPEPSKHWSDRKDMPENQFDFWCGFPGQGSYEMEKMKQYPYLAKYAENNECLTAAMADMATDFLRGCKPGEPFCLSVSFKAPHSPHEPDPAYDKLYEETVKFPRPANYGEQCAEHLPAQARSGRQVRLGSSYAPEAFDSNMSLYYRQIYGVDVTLGAIRDELKRLKFDDNTVIIFSSDNGYSCGSHGFGGKVLPYEEASRVPLIIYDPRHESAAKRRHVKQLAGNIDIAPTILDLAGLEFPKSVQGKTLIPLMSNPARQIHDSLLLINVWGTSSAQSLAVLTKRFKYIYWFDGDAAEELYDIENDPLEMKNLAGNPDYAAVLAQMQTKYDTWLADWTKTSIMRDDYQKYSTIAKRR